MSRWSYVRHITGEAEGARQLRVPPFLAEPLSPARREWAASVLRRYYGARRENPKDPFYTGSMFDSFGARGGPVETLDRITTNDIVAVSTLSVPVPAVAALRLLGPDADDIAAKIAAIDPRLTLAEATDCQLADDGQAGQAWSYLRDLKLGLGRVRTSKLLARKRPHLLPIYDKEIDALLGLNGTRDYWREIRDLLGPAGSERNFFLAAARKDASLESRISVIRTFDVLAWMWQKSDDIRRRLPTS